MLKKILNSNMIWAVIAVAVNCAINFLVVPYVTENVGVEAYGFVTLANTMVTYVDVIAIALNAFASRYIAIEYHRGDLQRANKYYSSAFIANVVLCIALSVLCLPLIGNLERVLNISLGLQREVKLLFCIVLFRYIFVLLRSALDVATFIRGRLDLTEKLRAVSYIIQATILLITCSSMQPSIRYVGMATAAAALFLLVAQYALKRRMLPELKVCRSDFSLACVKDFLTSGIWNAINNIGNLLNNGLDLLISNKLLSELLMGMISVSKTLGSLCYTLVVAVSNSFRPEQLKAYSEGDVDGLVTKFKKSMGLTGAMCAIIIAGFAVCGQEFLHLWIPEQDCATIYRLSLIVLLGDVVIGVVNPLYYVFTLTKRLKIPCAITVGMGLINVLGKFLLIHLTDADAYAVVLMTVFVNMVHFVDTPLYSAHCLGIRWDTFYPPILKHLLNCLLVYAAMWAFSALLPVADTWPVLLVKIVLLGGLGVLVSAMLLMGSKVKVRIMKGIGCEHK